MLERIKVKIVRFLRRGRAAPAREKASPERIETIRQLSQKPLADDHAIKRVEIVMLKYKEAPEVIDKAISNVVHRTAWPFTLRVYDNRPNPANISKVWNRLAKTASCEYVCIMDSDAFVPDLSPCWLTRMMESIDEKGVVVPLGDNVTGINKAVPGEPKPYHSSRIGTGVWTGFFFLFKKSLWEKEPFDEEFFIYGQDSEWAERLTKKYGGVVLRDDVLVHHIRGYSFKLLQKKGEIDREADGDYADLLLERRRAL